METWDIALLVVAGYVATFGLARLMTRRREQLIEQFREQMEAKQARAERLGRRVERAAGRLIRTCYCSGECVGFARDSEAGGHSLFLS